MSRADVLADQEPGRFPRVSGDEPALDEAVADVRQFSPRERG